MSRLLLPSELDSQLSESTREIMAKGSKSFSLAALLFDRSAREGARYLYSWCRYCDDAVDGAPSVASAQIELRLLEQQTHAAFHGRDVSATPFAAFRELCSRYSIPETYPLELIEGMRMDVDGFRYHTSQDLELYCYRVASVVGLMMVHVMGVSSQKALKHAVATGLAMQMTNIARDIRDDYEMGRIYIPEEWFSEYDLSPPQTQESFDPARFTAVVKRLVAEAEDHYECGRQGLRYLPFRAALAVGAAQEIYREIGLEVLKRGPNAWNQRTVIPLWRKLMLAGKGIGRAIWSRLRPPFYWKREENLPPWVRENRVVRVITQNVVSETRG